MYKSSWTVISLAFSSRNRLNNYHFPVLSSEAWLSTFNLTTTCPTTLKTPVWNITNRPTCRRAPFSPPTSPFPSSRPLARWFCAFWKPCPKMSSIRATIMVLTVQYATRRRTVRWFWSEPIPLPSVPRPRARISENVNRTRFLARWRLHCVSKLSLIISYSNPPYTYGII